VPPEPNGAVTLTECTAPGTTILRGTIDGKPYDQTVASFASINQIFVPFDVIVILAGSGHVDLSWSGVCLYSDGAPVPVVGEVILPSESSLRHVKACSLLWATIDSATHDFMYRYNLLFMNGDQLTGCTR